MFKRVIGSLLCAVSFTAWAETSCPAVSCDCASIPNQVWRNECLQQEQQLSKSCADGKTQGYCRMTGLGVQSPELWMGKLETRPTLDAQATIEQGQLLSWAVREANTQAILLQDRGDWRGALAQRRQEGGGQQQIYQLAVGLGEYYDARGQVKDRNFLFSDLIARSQEEAGRLARAAEALWATIPASATEEVAVKRALAQRMLRNAGDSLAQAADAARRNEQPAESARLWSQTAQRSVQLLHWMEEAGSTAKTQNFYRQRASARWYQAGLMALVGGDDETAMVAKQRSDTLRQAGS